MMLGSGKDLAAKHVLLVQDVHPASSVLRLQFAIVLLVSSPKTAVDAFFVSVPVGTQTRRPDSVARPEAPQCGNIA
jgi:hypothetical protein